MNFFFGRVVNDDETVATAEKRSRAAPTFPDLSRFTVSTLAKRQRENEKGWQSIGGISVRPMQQKNVDTVSEYEEAEWGVRGWSKESITRSLGGISVAVLLDDSVIGYISHDGGERKRFKDALFIDALFTRAANRMEGIAREMVNYLVQLMGLEKVVFETDPKKFTPEDHPIVKILKNWTCESEPVTKKMKKTDNLTPGNMLVSLTAPCASGGGAAAPCSSQNSLLTDPRVGGSDVPHSGPSEKRVKGGADVLDPPPDNHEDLCIPRCLAWARVGITGQDLEGALSVARDARRCDAGKPDVGGGGAYGWDVVHIAATRKQLRVLTLKNAEAILQAGECAQEYLYITGDVNKYFKYCGKRIFTWKNMGCKNLQEFEDDNDWSHTVLLHVATMTIHDPMFPK